MASRRLSSSLLRPFLCRSPLQFQPTGSFRSFSVPKFTSNVSPIAITKSPQTGAFSRFEYGYGLASVQRNSELGPFKNSRGIAPPLASRYMTTEAPSVDSSSQGSLPEPEVPPRIKFKRLDKTGRHIMQAYKEAVEEVRGQREIPDIKPGYIVQLKVEVPENKRRISIIKGIVIARRNAGLNTTFRIRRQVAGVGIESLFPLYSPNIKEIKVLDKKKVRRAKLYYLRDRMNALKN
ncbi:large subunit ribosomal protein L19 [Vigna unguiculata]|uniref:Large subunit ribosomal protein L19 n=1 Tax=Vigna unguiculata TaxID=3917 RepID=A0A4D6KUL9_VIGUN|nr:large subunit ribosomal protein L19 [Vigna unguiculata]